MTETLETTDNTANGRVIHAHTEDVIDNLDLRRSADGSNTLRPKSGHCIRAFDRLRVGKS